ncbi:MAG: ROK family protein [Polyangiaceae bacterium]
MRIGIDLGGTKIEGLALDDDGQERARERIATPGSVEAIVAAISGLVARLEATAGGPASVGVGTPGALSPTTGLLRNSNTSCLNGQPLDVMLEAALERPVRIANDADCLALSEAVDGAGAGARTVFAVILGTGTGGGIVVDGRLVTGPNAIAGEWGHNPLPWAEPEDAPAPACYCGKRGCLETYLSGPAIARDHRAVTGEALDARRIAARAEAGDPGAVATLARHRRRLAKGLASVINLLDPEVIVLGGGVSRIARVAEELPLADYVFSDAVSTPVRRSRHGDASGVRGAAWLWGGD